MSLLGDIVGVVGSAVLSTVSRSKSGGGGGGSTVIQPPQIPYNETRLPQLQGGIAKAAIAKGGPIPNMNPAAGTTNPMIAANSGMPAAHASQQPQQTSSQSDPYGIQRWSAYFDNLKQDTTS